MTHSDERAELYPFLYRTTGPAENGASLLEQVRGSTLQKAQDVIAARAALLAEYRESMIDAGAALAQAFAAGGKLLTFGNGGSATDARDAASDCLQPSLPGWRAVPAIALQDDSIITALGNDVGFEQVYARQIIAFGEAGDVALAFSTSGNSLNVRAALRQARRAGMKTIALLGDTGGVIAEQKEADYCFVARLQYIPRVQETHATVWHALLAVAQHFMNEDAEEIMVAP